ncbi:MAG: hypothetical protein IJW97_02725 [Clostridia bacterium]|nr:hypothetical protein [Clostridia bacterium]
MLCSLFLRLQKVFRKQWKNCEHIFLGKDNSVHFFVTGQRNEPKKTRLGAAAPKYPAASRANAAAPRRLTRTRLSDSKNFAFAASKRTAKNETLTTTESKNFFSSARRKPEQRAPRERGYVIDFMFHENILLFSIVNQKTL